MNIKITKRDNKLIAINAETGDLIEGVTQIQIASTVDDLVVTAFLVVNNPEIDIDFHSKELSAYLEMTQPYSMGNSMPDRKEMRDKMADALTSIWREYNPDAPELKSPITHPDGSVTTFGQRVELVSLANAE